MLTRWRDRQGLWPDLLIFLLLMTGLVLVIARGTLQTGYHWQWYRVPQYLFRVQDGRFIAGPLLLGLGVTLKIAAISLVFSGLIGLVTAFLRLSQSLMGAFLARLYLEAVRNTPLIVQIFFIYFVAAPVFGFGRFSAAVLALSLFEGAYAAEIFRAGIASVERGQWEAARSLGFNLRATYRHIILPQAFRRILPPLAGQAISLVKDTSLVSTIAVYDLAMQAQSIIADTYLVFEIWFTVAAIYMILTASISLLVHWLEKR